MHHSTAEKFAVTQLLQSGVPAATVSTQLRIPLTTVYNIKNVFNARGTVEAMPRSGRPKKMSPRDTRELVRIVKGERRATLGDITNSLSTSVSRQTVRNTLKEVGIRSRIAVKKSLFSALSIGKEDSNLLRSIKIGLWKIGERSSGVMKAHSKLAKIHAKCGYGEPWMKNTLIRV
jgi:transposase